MIQKFIMSSYNILRDILNNLLLNLNRCLICHSYHYLLHKLEKGNVSKNNPQIILIIFFNKGKDSLQQTDHIQLNEFKISRIQQKREVEN